MINEQSKKFVKSSSGNDHPTAPRGKRAVNSQRIPQRGTEIACPKTDAKKTICPTPNGHGATRVSAATGTLVDIATVSTSNVPPSDLVLGRKLVKSLSPSQECISSKDRPRYSKIELKRSEAHGERDNELGQRSGYRIVPSPRRTKKASMSTLNLEEVEGEESPPFRFDIDDDSSHANDIKRTGKTSPKSRVAPRVTNLGVSRSPAEESRDDSERLSISSATSTPSPDDSSKRSALLNVRVRPSVASPTTKQRSFGRSAMRIFRSFPTFGNATPTNADSNFKGTTPSSPRSPLFTKTYRGLDSALLSSSLTQRVNENPKITVVSAKYKILVVDMLSVETCDWILDQVRQHDTSCVQQSRKSWRKLYTHSSLDLPCAEILPLRSLTNEIIRCIRDILGRYCENRQGANALVPRTWKEPHLLHYMNNHTGMCMHYDGGDLTWQVMLASNGSDYMGMYMPTEMLFGMPQPPQLSPIPVSYAKRRRNILSVSQDDTAPPKGSSIGSSRRSLPSRSRYHLRKSYPDGVLHGRL